MSKNLCKLSGKKLKMSLVFPTKKIQDLRLKLIAEEFKELTEAINKKDFIEIADALTDILYVTYGAGHAFGINLDKCFQASARVKYVKVR